MTDEGYYRIALRPTDLTDDQLREILEHGTDVWAVAGVKLMHEHLGPGKFERADNPGLASRLYQALMDGWEDELTGDVQWDACYSRMGRFVVVEDDLGFFDYHEYKTEEKAKRRFQILDLQYAEWNDGED